MTQESRERQPVVDEEQTTDAATQDVGAGERRPPTSRLSQFAMVALVLAAVALSLMLLREYSGIIAPLFLGVNLLVTAYPIYTWLTKHRVPRWIGAIATGLTVLLVLLAAVGMIVWSVTSMVRKLSDYSAEFQQMYEESIAFLAQFGFDQAALLEQLRSISPASILNVVGNIASAGSGATGMIVVVVIVMVFMVMDLPSMSTRFGITDRLHPTFTDSLESFALGIRRYWLVTTVFGLIVAILDGVVLVVLGIPLPLVWVMLSFITNYIPNVGFVIGLVPPALLALFEKGPITALIVVVAYCVLNFVIQSIIQPKYTGESVGITPTVSFLSLLLWTAVFGALGALIALPFTLMIKAMLIDNDPRLRWVNALIAANPKDVLPEEDPPERESEPAAEPAASPVTGDS
ncbi:AI-2E family transporter [Tessaracoccus terricola]